MHVCFHICSVLSCFICFLCIYMYIFMYVYICMCVSVYLCTYTLLSIYVLIHTFVCKKVIQLTVSLVYVQVATSRFGIAIWVSILAFSFEIVKLNTTTWTKSSIQIIKINLGNMNSLFPTLIVNNSGFMYLFI